MPRCATAGIVAQLSAPAFQQLNPLQARAARDDLGRAEPDSTSAPDDSLGPSRILRSPGDTDDLDAGSDRAQVVGERHVGATIFFGRSHPARSRTGRPFAQLEALDELRRDLAQRVASGARRSAPPRER
jgi:hypothetical protein